MCPTLTYGNVSRPLPVEFIPAHVAFDKKVCPITIFRRGRLKGCINFVMRLNYTRSFIANDL